MNDIVSECDTCANHERKFGKRIIVCDYVPNPIRPCPLYRARRKR